MASMSTMTAVASAAPRYGASAQASAEDGESDSLFVQIMEQLQTLLEQAPDGVGGTALPLDGDPLPSGELVADLVGLAEQHQGELTASEQEQLAELVEQIRTAAESVATAPAMPFVQLKEAGMDARAGLVSVNGLSAADNISQSGNAAGSVTVEPGADSGDLESRQDGRRDGLREQGLARWVELRDTVVAQGQKLAQSEAAIKDVLGSQAAAVRGEVGSLSLGATSASLQQLQQVYQTAPAPGFGQRFGSQAWAPAASQRISWMAGQGISTAELRLDPPELGSLTIRLTIQGDQTSLSFTSPHAQVRDVLEQQMPRLREMLAENGLALGQADVSDQSSSNEPQEGRRGVAGGEELHSDTQQDGGLAPMHSSLALVDYYA